MLHNAIANSSELGHRILEWIEYAALAIEILAVVIIVGAFFYAMGHYLFRAAIRSEPAVKGSGRNHLAILTSPFLSTGFQSPLSPPHHC